MADADIWRSDFRSIRNNFLKIVLAFSKHLVYNSSSSRKKRLLDEYLALSPNGKATDSDSVIFKVRILVALLKELVLPVLFLSKNRKLQYHKNDHQRILTKPKEKEKVVGYDR